MFEKFIQSPRSVNTLLFLVPLVLYINTLWNDYALDDSIVITENNLVQQGWNGIQDIFTNDSFVGFFKEKKDLVKGGRYRPLSVATFAIEVAFGLNYPAISHLINALLYAMLCVVLYHTFQRLLQVITIQPPKPLLAFVVTLIFAIHPIHTEVVANIKGRDELLAGLFLLLSLHEYLRFLIKKKNIILAGSSILFFLGLLSKENAITLIPIAGFLIILTGKRYLSKGSIALAFLMLPAIIYLWLRTKFAGEFNLEESSELMNNPFLFAARNEKVPTILFTLLWYLKLLIIPHPLTFDYYPYHVSLTNWSSPFVWLSLVIHALILIGIFYYIKKNPILSFFLAFYLVTLLPLSNLFIDVGTFMNERFLFLPSIAFSFILAYSTCQLAVHRIRIQAVKKTIWILFSLLLILGSVKTTMRNRVWENNFTLFLHDVKTSSESAKGNCMAGGVLYEEALKIESEALKKDYLDQSVQYLQKSLRIYPQYIDALLLLGNAYHIMDTICIESISVYKKIFSLSPNYNLAYDNLNKILNSCADPLVKIKGYKSILKYREKDFNANYEMGITYGKALQNLDSAIIYLHRAVEIRPDSELAQRDLGVAYAMGGQYKLSLPYFEKALQINPDDPSNYINLGITLRHLGFAAKAKELFLKAESIK